MKDKPRGTNAPNARPVRSYRTRFRLDETPISEGGIWVNGMKDGIDWTDVITRNGVAYGGVSRPRMAERGVAQMAPGSSDAHPGDEYDDPTALLTGTWGKNQHGKGKVFSRYQTDTCYQEVEIRLRSSMTPHSCTGYEVFWRCLKTEKAYAYIARWNGQVRDFTKLIQLYGPQYGVKHGDLVEATVVGNVIKGYINGVEVISATDDTWSTGSPGIGFNYGVGDTNVDHGFTYFEVDTYEE